MRRRALGLAAVALLLITTLSALPASSSPEGELQAGAAKVELTPPVTTPMFGYTAKHGLLATGDDLSDQSYPRFLDQRDDGADTELYAKTFLKSQGVHTRLYANAFVLDDGQTSLAIVLTDLGGLPGEVHQAVAEELDERGVPIDEADLLIGATHTHGGPGGFFQAQGYALLGGDSFDPRIFQRVVQAISDAVEQAHGDLQPATMAMGEAIIEDASRNRSPDAHLEGHAHDGDHIDETARVIRLDATDGTPLGVITTFAAHGTIVGSGDLLLSGDNQGVASRLIARGIAQASPQVEDEHEVVVTYLNGAEGDISPIGQGQTFFQQVADAGQRQAGPILETWAELAGQGTREVPLDSRLTAVCFCGQPVQDGQRISTVPILGAGGTDPFPGFGIPGHDPKVPFLVGSGAVPHIVRVQAMRIGDHVMVSVPGEMSMALGQAIEHEISHLDTEHPIGSVDVVGLANDYISYMSTLGEYDHQAYEGTFNLYGRMTGPLFQQSLVALAEDLMNDAPATIPHQAVLGQPHVTDAQADDLELVPGKPADRILEAQTSFQPGETVTVTWLGGSPAVDHPPDEPMVQIVDQASGEVVVDDLGFTLQIRYEKVGTDEHRWSVAWPTDESTDPGPYTIQIDGRYVTQAGTVAGYTYETTLSGP